MEASRVILNSKEKKTQLFSKEEMQNISAFGELLKEIRARLKRDGVSIEDARQKLWIKHEKRSNV